MPVLSQYDPVTGNWASSTYTEDVSGTDATVSSPSPTPAETTDGGATAPTTPNLPSVVNPVGSLVDAARQFGPRLALHSAAVFLAFILIGVGVAVIAAPRASKIVQQVAPQAAIAAAGTAI